MELLVLSIVISIGFVILAVWIRQEIRAGREDKQDSQTLITWLESMQRTIDTTNKTVNEALRGSTADVTKSLQENTKQLNSRLDQAARVIGELQKELGSMTEVGRGIRSLQELLQSPKLRGNIGEQVLKDMIGQTFPRESFHLQYSFSSGTKVDAVLKTDAGLLCIDAKFPMEGFAKIHKAKNESEEKAARREFTKAVKGHIDDITNKYIHPEEGTMDFALMYIPSESVYYEIATEEGLMRYAQTKRVYPVSPNTLYAHLQVLLVSFMGKKLEEKSRKVLQLLGAISKEYEKTEGAIGTLGRHITNAHNSLSGVQHSFTLLGQKIGQAQSLPQETTPLLEE